MFHAHVDIKYSNYSLMQRIYIGHLPFNVDASTIVAALTKELEREPPAAAVVTVTPFSHKHRKKKGCENKFHPGFGYADIEKGEGMVSVDLVMQRLREVVSLAGQAVHLKIEQSRHSVQIAATEPKSVEEIHEQSKKRLAQRQHKKRQRARSNSRRNGMLMSLIAQIPEPGGLSIMKRFLPIVASVDSDPMLDWSSIWRAIPQCIDPAFDFVRKVALGENTEREEKVRLRTQLQQQQQLTEENIVTISDGAGNDGRKDIDVASDKDKNGMALLVGRSSALINNGSKYDGLTVRAVRKRSQIESFATVLAQIVPVGSNSKDQSFHIVDFGSGTGNLALTLAYLFPQCTVTAVDMNARSIELLQQRALAGGLLNITGVVGRIEHFDEPFDVAVALHACGVATDYALYKAQQSRAAYIMCPCCIGKLKFGLKRSTSETTINICRNKNELGGVGSSIDKCDRAEENTNESEMITHPRSQWLSDALLSGSLSITQPDSDLSNIPLDADINTSPSSCQNAGLIAPLCSSSPSTLLPSPPLLCSPDGLFAAMARAGDISHGEAHMRSTAGQTHWHAHEARLCKVHLDLDRNMCMQEEAYRTALMKLKQAELTGKSELLVGVPVERVLGQSGRQGVVTTSPPHSPPLDKKTRVVTEAGDIVGTGAVVVAERGALLRFPWESLSFSSQELMCS